METFPKRKHPLTKKSASARLASRFDRNDTGSRVNPAHQVDAAQRLWGLYGKAEASQMDPMMPNPAPTKAGEDTVNTLETAVLSRGNVISK